VRIITRRRGPTNALDRKGMSEASWGQGLPSELGGWVMRRFVWEAR